MLSTIGAVPYLSAPRYSKKRLRKCCAAPRLPDSGVFAPADPSAEIYSPLAGTTTQGRDIIERGGRYTSDFIWNVNWQQQLQYEEDVKELIEQGRKGRNQPTTKDQVGTLSFSRKALLDSMDVDLSAELRKPKKKLFPKKSSAPKQAAGQQQRQVYLKPSPAETRKWDRRGRFARVAAEKPVTMTLDESTLLRVEQERQQYAAQQQDLLMWALGFAGALLAITVLVYGSETGIAYAVGALGGIVYLRLLNKTVDGISQGGAAGGGALVGQPRLLIPVILALGLNRWNTLAAEEVGVTLQLLPMLVGFFTYKGAVIARSSVSLWFQMTSGLRDTESTGIDSTAAVQSDSGQPALEKK